MSPIQIMESPVQRYELKSTIVNQILKLNDEMCRHEIDRGYVRELAKKESSEIWSIADTNGTVFGFAITEIGRKYVSLHLICSIKRKGEGMRLFRNVLQYCLGLGLGMRLNPINKVVAKKYLDAAQEMGLTVKHKEKIIDEIPTNFIPEEELKIYDDMMY